MGEWVVGLPSSSRGRLGREEKDGRGRGAGVWWVDDLDFPLFLSSCRPSCCALHTTAPPVPGASSCALTALTPSPPPYLRQLPRLKQAGEGKESGGSARAPLSVAGLFKFEFSVTGSEAVSRCVVGLYKKDRLLWKGKLTSKEPIA